MSRDVKDLIVALDIGTSKVVAVVADILPGGRFEVLGLGQCESRGLRKGVVVNIETTVNSIQRALEEAELMADCKIRDVYTGIAGSHINSFNSRGMVAVRDKEVSAGDVARVIDTARAVNIPTDQQVLHVLTQEFVVDGEGGIIEPIGMSALRLEVEVHIVTGAVSAAQNIVKCVRRCGLEVQDLILQPLASSLACLTEDEKDLGVVLVDIGGGTTDIAIFTGGAIRHTAVVPIAGDQITNDIAAMLRTPTPDAEDIKLRHGVAKQILANADESVEVPGLGDRGPRQVQRQALGAIIEPRVEELFGLVQQIVRDSGYEDLLASGIVLTGGTALRVPQTRARCRAGIRRQPRRRDAQPAFFHRHGAAGRSALAALTRAQSGAAVWRLQKDSRPHEGVVYGVKARQKFSPLPLRGRGVRGEG